jgi:predicted transcriptional regulator
MIHSMPRAVSLPPEEQPVTITIRVPRDVADMVRAMAEREERSISWMTARLLRQALAADAKRRK